MKNKISFLILVNAFFLSNGVYSSEKNDRDFYGNTLCFSEEVVNFYCILDNQKTVSVCSDTSKGTQYSKYRYGTQDFVEMAFPNDLKDEKQKIYYADLAIGSVVLDDRLFFADDSYHYMVWFTDGGSSGLSVSKKIGGKIEDILFSRCDLLKTYNSLGEEYEEDMDWHKKFLTNYNLYSEYFY